MDYGIEENLQAENQPIGVNRYMALPLTVLLCLKAEKRNPRLGIPVKQT